jgi:hypothetical protein
MKDEPEPPRKIYQFKDKEFERVNKSLSASPDEAGLGNPNDVSIDIQDLYRSANASPVVKSESVPVKNEIHDILRENLARDKAAGLHDIEFKPRRKSKRTKDYLMLVIGGNLLLTGGFFIMPVFAGAGFVLYNVCLIWVMWVVMDDY